MTVIHMEVETTSEILQRLDRILQEWTETVETLERIARRVEFAWMAPATQEYVARVRGLRIAYARRLRLIANNHKKAWAEYFEWLAVDDRAVLPWSAYSFFEQGDEFFEFLDTWDKRLDRWSSLYDLQKLVRRLTFSTPFIAGMSGVAVVGGKQMFISRAALLQNARVIASKRLLRTFKEEFEDVINPKRLGFWITVGGEFIGETRENWKDYYGDPLRVGIATGIEGTIGVITDVALSSAGAYAGSLAGATLGGLVAGPVGAVIGAKVGGFVGPIAAHWIAEQVKIGDLPVTEWLEETVSDALTEPLADAVEGAAEAAEAVVEKTAQWAEHGIRSVLKLFGR